jgi:hypothetical protein
MKLIKRAGLKPCPTNKSPYIPFDVTLEGKLRGI